MAKISYRLERCRDPIVYHVNMVIEVPKVWRVLLVRRQLCKRRTCQVARRRHFCCLLSSFVWRSSFYVGKNLDLVRAKSILLSNLRDKET